MEHSVGTTWAGNLAGATQHIDRGFRHHVLSPRFSSGCRIFVTKPQGSLREQFLLHSPAPWLIFAATMFGNAGVFAQFSYIKPFMMYISGFRGDEHDVYYDAGRAGDGVRQSVKRQTLRQIYSARIAVVTDLVIVLSLIALLFFSGCKTASLTFAFICCAGLLRSLRRCKSCYCKRQKAANC